jgi:hypothetical protein
LKFLLSISQKQFNCVFQYVLELDVRGQALFAWQSPELQFVIKHVTSGSFDHNSSITIYPLQLCIALYAKTVCRPDIHAAPALPEQITTPISGLYF